MAGRRKRSESDAPALDLSTMEVRDVDPASIQWRESTAEPSPLQGAFDASAEALTNGAKEGYPKELVLNTEDEAKQAVQAVRRAASFAGLGAKVKTEQTEDGYWRVLFAAKPRKAPRKYNMQMVRDWAIAQGYELPEKGRVPSDVTKAYREAHGL